MKTAKNIFFLLTIVICFGPNQLEAQQISLSNQYVINRFALSPAYAGISENTGVFGSYRKDWVGFDGTPRTNFFSANGTISDNMGIGGSITSLQAGIFTNLSAMLYYAYHVQFSGNHNVSFGIGLGLLENHLDLSDYSNESDPVINNLNRNSTAFDASFGILYRNKNLHVGFSSPRLIGTRKGNYLLWPHRQTHIGYKYAFNNTWAIDPMLIVYLPGDAPVYYEMAIPVVYQNKIWLTLAFKKSSRSIGIGAKLKDNLLMNYSFEYSDEEGYGRGSSGIHEISIGWKFNKKNNNDLPKPDNKKPYYEWINK